MDNPEKRPPPLQRACSSKMRLPEAILTSDPGSTEKIGPKWGIEQLFRFTKWTFNILKRTTRPLCITESWIFIIRSKKLTNTTFWAYFFSSTQIWRQNGSRKPRFLAIRPYFGRGRFSDLSILTFSEKKNFSENLICWAKWLYSKTPDFGSWTALKSSIFDPLIVAAYTWIFPQKYHFFIFF